MGKILSIEITDTCTRACEMSEGKKIPVIYHSIIFDNPPKSVEDGYITDNEAYAAALREELKGAGIKTRRAVFTMTSNRIVNREILIPIMPPEKVTGLIENERTTYFPMDTADHVFSFFAIETIRETKQQRLMVYAAPRELVAGYRVLAAEAGLRIVRIDCSGNSISRWLVRPECAQMEMYLHINEKNTVFTITRNGMMALQRNMAFGLDSVDISSTMTERSLRPLITNIANVLEYYQNKNRDVDMSAVYVGGIGSGIPGLKELIEKEFVGIEVHILEKIPGVRLHKNNKVGPAYVTSFISCYGATVTSVNLNFGNEHKKIGRTLARCVFAEIVVVLASAVIIMNQRDAYSAKVTERNKLQHRLAELEAVGIEDLEYDYIASDEAAREIDRMDAMTETPTEHWNEMIDMLETECVSSMIVSYISSDPTQLSMNVTVGSKEEAALLIEQLKSIPYFTSVQTSGITETGGETIARKKVVSFSVICSYTDEAEQTEVQEPVNPLLESIKSGIQGAVGGAISSAVSGAMGDGLGDLSGLGININ